MNTMKMPGFTAAYSLYGADEHFRTGEPDTFRTLNAEVIPQIPPGGCYYTEDGTLRCPQQDAKCRSDCYVKWRNSPQRLADCLAEC